MAGRMLHNADLNVVAEQAPGGPEPDQASSGLEEVWCCVCNHDCCHCSMMFEIVRQSLDIRQCKVCGALRTWEPA